MAARIRALRRTWPILDSNEPNGPDWKITFRANPVTQASADLAKRLALESAVRLGGEKLSPEEA